MNLKKKKFKLVGTAPLLMHNGRLADPLNSYVKKIKEITSKRTKTDDDLLEIARLEFLGGMYESKNDEPVIPADCIEAMLIKAAKSQKLGTAFKSAVFCVKNEFPLKYTGPKTKTELWKDERFRDTRGAVPRGQGRVMRTRARFDKWETEVEVSYSPQVVNEKQVVDVMKYAGLMVGIMDFRPKYGRFEATPV